MITLNNSTTLVKRIEESAAINTVTIDAITDFPDLKVVEARIIGYNGVIILWSGDAYDSIGQWTDSDVSTRIKALADAGTAPFRLS